MKTKTKISLIFLIAILLTALAAGITVYAASTVTEADWIAEPPKRLIKCEGNGCDHTACDYLYSFAVIGDTQSLNYIDACEYAEAKKSNPSLTYEGYTQARMRTLYNWILTNKESKNIQYVLGVGDITQSNTSSGETYIEEEWELAKEAIALLDGNIGYSLVRGNHDLSEDINASFGAGSAYHSSLLAMSSEKDSEGRPMAGFRDGGKMEDTYRKITAEGNKYIIFTLDYYPTEQCIDWLNEILSENSDYTAIITLHAFLYKDEAFHKPDDTYGGVTPRELWERSLSLHRNVKLVLSGHVSVDEIAVNQLSGKNGNTVTFLLTDGQDIDETVEPVGLVTMLYISADGRTVHVEHISTVREAEGKSAYLMEENQFSMTIDHAVNGESGWTETKYGFVPTAQLEANAFHILLDDDSDLETAAFHMGSYNAWEETLSAIHAYNGIGEQAMRENKTYYILMTGNFTYSGGTAPVASNKNPGKIVLDLNGNTLTVAGKGLFLPIYTATNKYIPSFTVKNGSVTHKSARPFAVLQTYKAVDGAIYNVAFDSLTVSWEGVSVPFIDTYAGQSGYNSSIAVTVTDCVFDTTRASGSVTVFALKDEYNNCRVTLTPSGGSFIASSPDGITPYTANNGIDAVTASTGADGEYPIFVFSEKQSFSTALTAENGSALTYATVSENTPYIYRATVAEAVSGQLNENIGWTLSPEGVLTVFGKGAMPDFNAGEAPWSPHSERITGIIVENGIVTVGRCAFYGLSAVTSVTLPETLAVIDEYAFYGCSALDSLTVPKSVYYIGEYAFRRTALSSLTVENPGGWTANGAEIFPTVENLTKANYKKTFMREVTEAGEVIASGSFGKSGTLNWSLTATGELKVWGIGAMPYFSSSGTPWYGYKGMIRTVTVTDGVTEIGRCSFHTCRPLISVALPKTLTNIQPYAFYNCINLKKITIPESTVGIGKFAFRKCRSLTEASFAVAYGWYADGEKLSASEITVTGADMLSLSHYKYDWRRDGNAVEEAIDPLLVDGGSCNSRITWRLTYKDETKTEMKLTVSGTGAMPNYGTAATPWYKYLEAITEIEVTEGVTVIGRCAFYGLKRVTSVTLPNGLTEIGDYAFNTCKSLSEIDIPETVTHVAPTAFGKTAITLTSA